MKKCKWIDPELSADLRDTFINYGTKINITKGEIIQGYNEIFNCFYYIEDGLLAVTVKTNTPCDNMIVKLIPEKRAFGFTDYTSPGLIDTYCIISLRDGVAYKLPYTVMTTLINKKLIDVWGFNRYASISKQGTRHTYSVMMNLPRDRRIYTLCAVSLVTEIEGTKGSNSFKLSREDISILNTALKENGQKKGLDNIEDKEKILTALKYQIYDQ